MKEGEDQEDNNSKKVTFEMDKEVVSDSDGEENKDENEEGKDQKASSTNKISAKKMTVNMDYVKNKSKRQYANKKSKQ